jgi:hypothetical protein
VRCRALRVVRIEEQVRYLDANPAIDVVGTAVAIFSSTQESHAHDQQTATEQKSSVPLPSGSSTPSVESASAPGEIGGSRVIRHPSSSGFVHWAMFFFCALAHPTVMARRNVFKVALIHSAAASLVYLLVVSE